MRNFLLSLCLMSLCATAWGQDFVVDGIAYDSNGETTCKVVYNPAQKYAGDLVIPQTVDHGGVDYTVTEVGSSAFYMCGGLTSVQLPSSVTQIGPYAFSGCTSLKSIEIPNDVNYIGFSAFSRCTSLTSITIPDAVTEIGGYAFKSCEKLSSVKLPNGLDRIDDSLFSGCISLTGIEIPSSVTTIAQWAFSDTGLTEVTIPSSVTVLGDMAFQTCYSLKKVNFSEGLKKMRLMCFYQCTALDELTLPASLDSIGKWALYGCTSLKTINARNPEPVECEGLASADTYAAATLYVPKGSLEAYKATESWKNFATIKESDFSGVASIDAAEADAPASVYSINGALVGKGIAPSQARQSLSPGLYIIGNKKVLVK